MSNEPESNGGLMLGLTCVCIVLMLGYFAWAVFNMNRDVAAALFWALAFKKSAEFFFDRYNDDGSEESV